MQCPKPVEKPKKTKNTKNKKTQKKTDSWIAEGLGLVGLCVFFFVFLCLFCFLFFFVFSVFFFLAFWLCDTEDTEAFSIIHSLKYSVFALV